MERYTIRAAAPDAAIGIIARYYGGQVFEAIRAGAFGYIGKNAPGTELHAFVRQLAHGAIAISRHLAASILGAFVEPKSQYASGSLTTQEVRVLVMVAAGKPHEEIATILGVTPNTVKVHLRNVLEKLQHPSRGDEDGGDFSGDRAPRPRPGGSPVRVASVALPLPEPEEPPLPDWLIRAFPDGFEPE